MKLKLRHTFLMDDKVFFVEITFMTMCFLLFQALLQNVLTVVLKCKIRTLDVAWAQFGTFQFSG